MSVTPDKPDNASDSLIAFYHETWNEIARLRQFEWTIGYYFTSIAGGLIALSAQPDFETSLPMWVIGLLCLFQVVSMIFAGFYLALHHRYLTEHRRVRGMLESTLGYYKLKSATGEAVTPEAWQRTGASFFFQLGGIVLPILFAVWGVQALSIYMIGRPLWHAIGQCLQG